MRGDENVLKKLEDDWECIQIQTNWKLEHCKAPIRQIPINSTLVVSKNDDPENSSMSRDITSPVVSVGMNHDQACNLQTL